MILGLRCDETKVLKSNIVLYLFEKQFNPWSSRLDLLY